MWPRSGESRFLCAAVIVTGSSESGQWVRIFAPPAEGRLDSGPRGLEVGEQVRVKLASTDVERGFIDFVAVD